MERLVWLVVFVLGVCAGSAGAAESKRQGTSWKAPSAVEIAMRGPIHNMVILGQDDREDDKVRVHLMIRAKELRTFGGVMIGVAAFPLLPLGIATWVKGEKDLETWSTAEGADSKRTFGMVLALNIVPMMIFGGILALVHADILEDICHYAGCGEVPEPPY